MSSTEIALLVVSLVALVVAAWSLRRVSKVERRMRQAELGADRVNRRESAELRELLGAEIVRRFGAHNPVLGEGEEVAMFKCPSGAIGDVIVELSKSWPEVTIFIGDMHHSHFGYEIFDTPVEIVEGVSDWLADLFDGKIVVWADDDDHAGGSFYREHYPDRRPIGTRAGTWSEPWPTRNG